MKSGSIGNVLCTVSIGAALLAAPSYAQQPPALPTADGGLYDRNSSSTNGWLRDGQSPSAAADRDSADDRQRRADSGTNDGLQSQSTVLSANQIFALMHRRPEMAVDLKQVMSDYYSSRGITVEPDSITDDVLFSNIAASAPLRRAVSTWLRARGYANDQAFANAPEAHEENFPGAGDGTRSQDEMLRDRTGSIQPQADDERLMMQELRQLPPGSEVAPRDPSFSDIDPTPRPPDGRDQAYRAPPAADKTKTSLERSQREEREEEDPGQANTVQQPTPYNLQSLRDLYTQVTEPSVKLKRFGADVFLTRGFSTREMPIDLPIGPDYILGPGDAVVISVWGGVAQNFQRTVDREGRVTLPEAGPVEVAGLTLERTQELVQSALSRQFHDARVIVSVARLRTVRVYVVGDVQRPGAYDISSLSTVINALYAAGGPTAGGSLRSVRHMRGNKLVREVDLYEFLRSGLRADGERLEPGDTVLVPAVGAQVEVSGMVKRPAKYEVKPNETLAQLLEDAGGLTATAALARIRVERVDGTGHRVTTTVALPEGSSAQASRSKLESFGVQDGDRVIVAPILPYSERVVYLAGHVVRPGRVPYRDGMTLADVLRSYRDMLPEPADRAEVVRLMPPDLRPEAIPFRVSEVVSGGNAMPLQPFDTVRVHGRYDADAPRVMIRGEVLHPGSYALTDGMTAAQLVRIAGGFRRSALLTDADLSSYEIRNGESVETNRRMVAIGRAVNEDDATADMPLKPGDVLSVHQLSGWNNIGASITLLGEVMHPGTYGIEDGERLSSVIKRAGGFRSSAYVDGSVMVRRQVRELEEKSRTEMIRQIETSSVAAKVGTSATGGEDAATLQALLAQQTQILQRLKAQPSVGRMVLGISSDVAQWENTPADVEIRAGDLLSVPKRPGFVLVSGQVYNPSAITFAPGKDAGWYLRNAGGETDLANHKEVFVIRANGEVIGRRSGEKVLAQRLNPGDVIVVPQKIIGGSVFWKNTLAAAQVVSSIAFTGALALR